MRAADIFDDPILRKRPRQKRRGIPVTVCIAARGQEVIVVASDRLLTAGDIQFEPQRHKVLSITKSIVIMTAGDASFLTLILPRLFRQVQADLEANSSEWYKVRRVVDLYVEFFEAERRSMAEAAILAPFGLTMETFLAQQQTLSADFVRRISTAILEYQVPDCAVIIAGKDDHGTHLYSVSGTEISGHDDIGFASIGIGARHANSQFMLARHAWHGTISDTLLLTYVAKRRSEAAPGVGTETDLMIIGPNLGDSIVVNDAVKEHLRIEYDKIVAAEGGVMGAAKAEIARYMAEITATPTLPGDQGAPPENDEGPKDD